MRVTFSRSAIAVLAFAFAIRLAATLATPVINLDGILYINQAKALIQGTIAEDLACLFGFLPLNSVLIAFFSLFLPGWILAAKAVSLLCGGAALVPIYLIAKRFFEERICILLLLLCSLIPILVNSSVEIIRDPIAWMFFSFAILLFIKNQEKNSPTSLFSCAAFFLLSSWARGEFFFFYLLSALFLLTTPHLRRMRMAALFSFLAPLVIVVVLSVPGGLFSQVEHYVRKPPPINTETAKGLLGSYTELQKQLKVLVATLPNEENVVVLKNFLPQSANLLWLIALGMIATHLCEAVSYFYLPLFLSGIILHSATKGDHRRRYLLWMTLSAFILLYARVIKNWDLEYRWLGAAILSAAVFAGYGLQRLDLALRGKFHLSSKMAAILIGGLIILPGATKLLRQNYTQQTIVLEIAQTILSEQQENREPVYVAATQRAEHARALVEFYVNLTQPQAICFNKGFFITENDIENPSDFVTKLEIKNTKYVLLDESINTKSERGNQHPYLSPFATQLAEWHHSDLGQITLYRIGRLPESSPSLGQ
ncbi:MAG: hypothetical protein A2512_04725 [Deltaproteobacteria bacterium RIFOXYD12_FULL_56_24]|nr:MAG: hypothetical protein A2512_04725 [Deltaproteobacteria bacterium RIFOXYD12_FULL_56_24]